MSQAPGIFDPAPLLRHLELQVRAQDGPLDVPYGLPLSDKRGAVKPCDDDIAAAAGVSRRAVQRWRRGKLLCEADADRIACRLGLHPTLLWSSWYTED